MNESPNIDNTLAGRAPSRLNPLSLAKSASFIEVQFPVGRISAEAFKERKAVQSQRLTPLGSYWKGRKPLILVRAVVLGTLLPATISPSKDLSIFLSLLGMDDAAIGRRFNGSPSELVRLFPNDAHTLTVFRGTRRVWNLELDESERQIAISNLFLQLPYEKRLDSIRRTEECSEAELLGPIWQSVNEHLGTDAFRFSDLIEQLGVARFGHRPKIADTFSGGGSIPFESARMGCDVFASDLNPVAAMLTWGAFNIIGVSESRREAIRDQQEAVLSQVEQQMDDLNIETDDLGNRAKAFLYCLETRCTKTGWLVPMLPSLVISNSRNVIADLVPHHDSKSYRIDIISGVSSEEMERAKVGTVRGGRLVHPMNSDHSGVDLKTIRGDYRDSEGHGKNALREWTISDFVPAADDIFLERLYCILWTEAKKENSSRLRTFFSAISDQDIARERRVEAIVRKNIANWQLDGLIPTMAIQPGDNTSQPIRERGWTYWHHLFGARHLLILASLKSAVLKSEAPAELLIGFAKTLDWANRLCYFGTGASRESISHLFANQAINTLINYGSRPYSEIRSIVADTLGQSAPIETSIELQVCEAVNARHGADILVTDPPYADAINYHEITEFFIAWLRSNPPSPFDNWIWDSQRTLAIRGRDEEFRRDMVATYSAMTAQMPDQGLQVVMFTHQDAGVWADLGGILWAAGLEVRSAWNIATETVKPSGKGNFVQGTVCLALRKRTRVANVRRMEIEAEIEESVKEQIRLLSEIDAAWSGEALYTDGDLTLAAYAAALRVVTSYTSIDRQALDRDLYRKLRTNEKTLIRDLVDYAARTANAMLVPSDFPKGLWRDLDPASRFYVRMADMESRGAVKFADFQNFAKSFAYSEYTSVMESTAANEPRLAAPSELRAQMLDGTEFSSTILRQVLFAIWKTIESNSPKVGVTILRTEFAADYWTRRQTFVDFAVYLAAKFKDIRPVDSNAAYELAESLKLDRI